MSDPFLSVHPAASCAGGQIPGCYLGNIGRVGTGGGTERREGEEAFEEWQVNKARAIFPQEITSEEEEGGGREGGRKQTQPILVSHQRLRH